MDKAKQRHLEIYRLRGWFQIPLFSVVDGKCCCHNPDCKSKGKHPLIKGGFKNAEKDFSKFKNQLRGKLFDNCNIGIATGKSGLVVIDVDGQKGGFETWKKFSHVESGWKVLTGNGFHLYYTKPTRGPVYCGTDVLGPGVDVRAVGGYTVAPPSTHEYGIKYTWVLDGTGGLTPEVMADPTKKPPMMPKDLEEPLILAGVLKISGSKSKKKTGKEGATLPNDGTLPPPKCPSTPPPISTAKKAVSLLSVIEQDGLEIEYRGKKPFVKCPIHGEKNASLTIDDDEGVWYCHGCQKGGDIITWFEEVHKMQKSEAIQKLYMLAGMENFARPKKKIEIDKKKLLSSDKKKVKKLLKERRPTEEIVHKHFQKYDFTWQEKEKLYSNRIDKLLSKSVLVERVPRFLQDYLIDNAEELAPRILPSGELAEATRKEAISEWHRNAKIVVADLLSKIPPRPKGIIIEEELIQVESAVKKALSSEIKIKNDNDMITKNTTVLNQALETESQNWVQISDSVGVFVKAPGYIAIRYDFLIPFFTPVLQGLSRKTFARVLKELKIAKSKPIRKKMRAYLIETEWLEETFDVSLSEDIKGDDMVDESLEALDLLPKKWTRQKEDAECKVIEFETKAYLDDNFPN